MIEIHDDKVCAVIAHDAGGAEVISSYIRRQELACVYALEGPAIKIFENKLGKIECITLENAVKSSEWILCGSSWQSEIEIDAIKLARKLSKKSVVYLDHWVNYRERFEINDELILPDEIWVGDSTALEIAKKTFFEIPIVLKKNPYFLDVKDEAKKYIQNHTGDKSGLTILYICEPVREHALKQYGNERYWGYTEEDAINYFLKNISALGKPIKSIIVRPHPSESLDKYGWIKQAYEMPITFSMGGSLVREIQTSDTVVGCSSMAMVIGLLLGKQVVSCIPPEGGKCRLPQDSILSLEKMVKG